MLDSPDYTSYLERDKTMWVQAELSRGNKRTVAWIKKKKGVEVGSRVALKDLNNEFWTIDSLGFTRSNSQMLMMYDQMKNFGASIK